MADDAFFYSALLVLVAVASFGLGRQSIVSSTENKTVKPPQNQIQALVPLTNSTVGQSDALGGVVASKSGSKYHLPDCPGASQIKPENVIEFVSVTEAEAAGYEPAANCQFE